MICFFFNETATTEIYTLSLHDALPIFCIACCACMEVCPQYNERSGFVGAAAINQARLHSLHPTGGMHRRERLRALMGPGGIDRKSTRLNSSHANISYAVFCLKKKNQRQ